MNNTDEIVWNKLSKSIVITVLLTIGLCITTYALVISTLSMKENVFQTGSIDINLNDSKPIITEYEFLFEPGMTVKKDFFIENEGTWDVYYKIYFDNVSGGLKDVLKVSIMDKDKVMYSGTISELNKKNVSSAEHILAVDEKKTLTMYFTLPKDTENLAQNMNIEFDVCTDAVQTKNNPKKLFD